MDNKRRLCFDWEISDHSGWGIYGSNLLMYGQKNQHFQPVPLVKPSFLYPLDPLLHKFLTEGLPPPNTQINMTSQDILLSSLGNSNAPDAKKEFRNIGVIFSERNPLPKDEIQKLKNFEFLIAGSSWNASALKECGIKTHTVIQGIDLDLFRPMPKRHLKDKFVVFSGGKLEYRKGQDIALKAFSRLAAKHDDVVLLTAWRSPSEVQFAATINESGLCDPFEFSGDIGKSTREWILKNGIKLEQVISIDSTPNRLMPEIYREIDLAVFPNRCEGGTNLVAMEALAFGLTCLISKNTGHLDIIRGANCLPLTQQKSCLPLTLQNSINKEGFTDWGESSIDEMVDLMEEVYQGRMKINPMVARESMLSYSWENTINSMLSLF